jgi:hypothetical protein
MRYLFALTLLATACADVPRNGFSYDSVRDRMSDVPLSLYVRDEVSFGAVTTQRRAHDGWLGGPTKLTVERGYVRAALDDNGQLSIQQLEIEIAPLTLDGMFDRPARMHDMRLRLTALSHGDVEWKSEDEASATLPMMFDFGGAIAFDSDEPFPLATQHLPRATVEVVLTGSGEHVAASLGVEPPGALWNWADLVQLTELSLSVNAETAD